MKRSALLKKTKVADAVKDCTDCGMKVITSLLRVRLYQNNNAQPVIQVGWPKKAWRPLNLALGVLAAPFENFTEQKEIIGMRNMMVVLAASLLMVGCANLSTIGRSHEPLKNTAIHLDAPQRLVIANEFGEVCAEPSPDALQAYASSFGLGFSAPSKESGSFAQALSASAGSIGLRTQSITLMRDALYRICELYYNGGITKGNAVQLLQRSQELSLGILAIEQLTGAVVAQQVNINTNSAATAAASINDIQKELDKAKADEGTKKTALDSAQTALDAQKKTVADKTTEATAAKANAKGTQDAIDDLSKNLTDAQTALENAIKNRVDSKLKVVDFEEQVTKGDKRANDLIQKVDKLHGETVAAEKAHQDAVKANKDPTKLADLEAKHKAADEAEKEAVTQRTQAQAKLKEAKEGLAAAKLAGQEHKQPSRRSSR